MPDDGRTPRVHVVSHGPRCLDGIVAAVVVARAHQPEPADVVFSRHAEIDRVLLAIDCPPGAAQHELWITDITWTDPAVDCHLQRLAAAGTRIFWIDHHRSAIERHAAAGTTIPFAGRVLSERYATARLVYDYLRARRPLGEAQGERLAALERLVALTDDHDRWLHEIPGSHELALTVSEMHDREAYEELLAIDSEVTYTPRMEAAAQRVEGALRRSCEVAARSRVQRVAAEGAVTVVAAVCDGYASEIGAMWGQQTPNAIFAFYDVRSLSVSLRRSPDCQIDLSRLAARLGGGGHPAAAGYDVAELHSRLALEIAESLAERVF